VLLVPRLVIAVDGNRAVAGAAANVTVRYDAVFVGGYGGGGCARRRRPVLGSPMRKTVRWVGVGVISGRRMLRLLVMTVWRLLSRVDQRVLTAAAVGGRAVCAIRYRGCGGSEVGGILAERRRGWTDAFA
jgi:hypothetical protein